MAIPNKQRYGYSIGHFQNDVCASMWFTYLLIYFKKVIQISKTQASYLLLIGQLVDGIFTPVVGILSDSVDIPLVSKYYSRRKSWHAVGIFLVTVSFIFIFSPPVDFSQILGFSEASDILATGNSSSTTYSNTTSRYNFYYYLPFITIFQIGWATVQISHLSLIPTLTSNDKERSDLNSKRYSFLILANAYIYVLAIFVFNSSECKYSLTPKNQYQFSTLAYTAIVTGLILAIIFHVLVKENKNLNLNENSSQESEDKQLQEPLTAEAISHNQEPSNQNLENSPNLIPPIIELSQGNPENSNSTPNLKLLENTITPYDPDSTEIQRSSTMTSAGRNSLKRRSTTNSRVSLTLKDLSRAASRDHMVFMLNKNLEINKQEEFLRASIVNMTDEDGITFKINHNFESEHGYPTTILNTPLDWMKYLPMYSNAVIYISARLATNCLQMYLTLYISDTIKLKTTYLGILPFIQYFFGFLASLGTKYIQKKFCTKTAYSLGCVLVFIGCASVYLLGNPNQMSHLGLDLAKNSQPSDNLPAVVIVAILIIFALFGAGSNMVVCSALGLTAELIGDNIQSSAFVYGLMSLGDKIINGIAVIILEGINSCPQIISENDECVKTECNFYGTLISLGIAGILVFGFVFVLVQMAVAKRKAAQKIEKW